MLKRFVKTIVVLAVLGGVSAAGIHRYCPGLWTQIDRKVTEVVGWTEEAREADPVGFIDHASAKLEQDLAAMRETGRALAAEIGEVSKKIREQEALRDGALALAAEFRTQYQLCSTNAAFPVTVRNAAYTEDQVKSQVSMLLAEAEGYEASLNVLTTVRDEAEAELEKLTVRMDTTDAQLAALAAQKPMLRARALSSDGEKLFAQVDALMRENDDAIEGSPIRNVRQLLAASDEQRDEEPTRDAVAQAFLAQLPSVGEENEEPVQVAAADDKVEFDLEEPTEETSPSDSDNTPATDPGELEAAEEEAVVTASGTDADGTEETVEDDGAASDAEAQETSEPILADDGADEVNTDDEAKIEEDGEEAAAAEAPTVAESESAPAEPTIVDAGESDATAEPAAKPQRRPRKRNSGKVRRASHEEEDPLATSQVRVHQF